MSDRHEEIDGVAAEPLAGDHDLVAGADARLLQAAALCEGELQRLAREIQEHILSMAEVVRRPAITERALRPIARLESITEQKARFGDLVRYDTGRRPRHHSES